MTLHPQAVRALELWAQWPQVTDPGFGPEGIEALRRAAREAAAVEPREPVGSVAEVDADGVRCRLHRPGGVDVPVLTVDYRRAPEQRFPAAPDDAGTALRWARREADRLGLDASRVALCGDSAGANLAMVATLREPDQVCATVLVYPFLDPAVATASYHREDGGGLTSAEARWYWQQYAASADDLTHPDLAPLRSSRRRFAQVQEPVLVQAAEHDPLVDENRLLVDRLREARVDVTLTTYPGMVHGFWRHPSLFDAAEEALAEVAAFLRRHV